MSLDDDFTHIIPIFLAEQRVDIHRNAGIERGLARFLDLVQMCIRDSRYAEQVDQFVTALVRLQKSMDKLSQTMDGKE